MIKAIGIDFGNLWSFLIGIFFGASILVLLYLVQVLANLKKGFKGKKPAETIEKEEVVFLVNEALLKFKDKELRQEQSKIPYLTYICKELVNDIAAQFYPKSKYPIYELTIDESLSLVKYVSDRVNEILDRRGIRTIKKITIAKIIGWASVKKSIDESKLVKISSKYRVRQIFKTAMGIINLVNPIYWAKRLVVSSATNLVVNKICLITISIVGEETYKIYSKKVFDKEDSIDTGINVLTNEIDENLKDIKEDEIEKLNDLDILNKGDESNAFEKEKKDLKKRRKN